MRARSVNPFSWPDEGRPILKPQGPQSQDPRSSICHCDWYRLNFTSGNEHAGESWVVMHQQIYGFLPKNNQDQHKSMRRCEDEKM